MVDDSEWVNDLKKIKEDSSFISIYTHLWENVFLGLDAEQGKPVPVSARSGSCLCSHFLGV